MQKTIKEKRVLLNGIAISFLLFSCSVKPVPEYILHYRSIDSAEVCIQKYKYQKAIEIYERNRTAYLWMFYSDLHNLLLCYAKTKQYYNMPLVALQLAKQGYTYTDLENIKELKPFLLSKDWKKVAKKFSKEEDKYRKKRDTVFTKLIMELSIKDQMEDHPKIDSIHFAQGFTLMDQFLLKGFPRTFIDKTDYRMNLFLILRHYFNEVSKVEEGNATYAVSQKIKDRFNMHRNLFENALKEGLIKPNDFLPIRYYTSHPFGDIAIVKDYKEDRIYLTLWPPDSIEEKNTKRKSIGLPPIDTTEMSAIGGWYANIDMKQLKQAIAACDTCQSYRDIMRIISIEQHKINANFKNNELDGFILKSFEIRNFFSEGFKEYIKLVHPHINLTQ